MKKIPWRKGGTRSGFTVAAVLCAIVAVVGFVSWWAECRLDARLQAYSAAGAPVRLAQMANVLPSVPERRNSAVRYARLFEKRTEYLGGSQYAEDVDSVPFLDRTYEGTLQLGNETKARCRLFIEKNADWFAALDDVAACTASAPRFYTGCTLFAELRHPIVLVLEHAVRSLCMRAAYRNAHGDVDGCIEDLERAQRINRQMLAEPFMVNVVSTICGENAMYRVARAAAGNPDCSTAGRRRLRELCVPVSSGWLQRAVQLERLSGLDYLYCRDRPVPKDNPYSLSYLKWMPKVLCCSKLETYLDYTDVCKAVFDLPPSRQLPVALTLEDCRARKNPLRNPLLSLATPISAVTQFYRNHVLKARKLRNFLATREDQTSAEVSAFAQ